MGNLIATVDIEIYEDYGDGKWAQARYLVHGADDVLWTNDLKIALKFLGDSIEDKLKKHCR